MSDALIEGESPAVAPDDLIWSLLADPGSCVAEG